MGNSPSTDLGRAELRDPAIEVVDTKGEKSSEVNELAHTNSKSKDDESLNQKPLHDDKQILSFFLQKIKN